MTLTCRSKSCNTELFMDVNTQGIFLRRFHEYQCYNSMNVLFRLFGVVPNNGSIVDESWADAGLWWVASY